MITLLFLYILHLSIEETLQAPMAINQNIIPYIFPETQSTALPNPSNFFSPNFVSRPLPTNSFFQNFVIEYGDQPEYIHPYLIKSSYSSLSVSYPSHQVSSEVICQIFKPDLTISSQQGSNGKHFISSFSNLSVTLDISCNMRFFLVRGSPFLTFSVSQPTPLSITTIHAIHSMSSNYSKTKFTLQLNNDQIWLLYASSTINLSHSRSEMTSNAFSGIIRIVLLSDSTQEVVLDKYSTCYPISGEAVFREPFCVEYKWKKRGFGDMLLLAHPLHLKLLSKEDNDVFVLGSLKYKSIDGDLVGVVGNSWILKTDPVPLTWYSINGVKENSRDEIVSSLLRDVWGLNSSAISTTSSYFFGKLIARAARLALIAEELSCLDLIPKVCEFLKETIEPWLEGTFKDNGFLHDKKWGGIITKEGSNNRGADFGFGIYNNHHCHLGYFLYGIAVLTKLDPAWGRKYKPQAYSLVQDFMNLETRPNSNYTRLRCFDFYVLHSWSGGLHEFRDGRNCLSTSEAVNAYYSAALLGLAYGDASLVSLGSTLTALEILGTKMWWHVEEGGNVYDKEFTKENRIIGVLSANKRESGLWFAESNWRECRLAIHVLPLVPISEVLFSNVDYVKELVKWTLPAFNREFVGVAWKGFVYALEGVYDNHSALAKIRTLSGSDFDSGNSKTNLLWWIHSRGD